MRTQREVERQLLQRQDFLIFFVRFIIHPFVHVMLIKRMYQMFYFITIGQLANSRTKESQLFGMSVIAYHFDFMEWE